MALVVLAGCDSPIDVVVVDTEKEANRVMVELERRGVSGADKSEKEANRQTVYVVSVPEDQVSRSRQILVDLDLPREKPSGLEEMVGQTGLIPTRTDERARLMHAIAGELEATLMTYEGVVRARVHVVIPDSDVMLSAPGQTAKTPSATVLVKYIETDAGSNPPTPDEEQRQRLVPAETEVQEIIVGGIEGLDDSQHVKVKYTPAFVRAQSEPREGGDVEGGEDTGAAGAGADLDVPAHQQPLVQQLFAVIVGLGLLVILLIILLMRKGRRARAATA